MAFLLSRQITASFSPSRPGAPLAGALAGSLREALTAVLRVGSFEPGNYAYNSKGVLPMKIKLKIDWPGVKTATRTCGALMIGNTFINVIVLGNRQWIEIGLLTFFGLLAIIGASIDTKE
jgi:hypothetical protein